MNVFGDNRNIGPPGQPGKDAFDIMKWMPMAGVQFYRQQETVNFFFKNETDGLIFEKNKPIALKNHGVDKQINGKFLGKKFPKLGRVKNGPYYLLLKDSIFHIENVQLGTVATSTVVFALTFRALKYNRTPGVLFSSHSGSRSLSVFYKTIYGREVGVAIIKNGAALSEEIEFEPTNWSSIVIQYRVSENGISYCQWRLNDQFGGVEASSQPIPEYSLYIGGHPSKNSVNEALANFEIYFKYGDDELSNEFMDKYVTLMLENVEEIDNV